MREQESKARDSAPTQGFWHSTQNGLDKGDRKIHKNKNITYTHTHNGLNKEYKKIGGKSNEEEKHDWKKHIRK